VKPSVSPKPGRIRLFHQSWSGGSAVAYLVTLFARSPGKKAKGPGHSTGAHSRPSFLLLVNLIEDAAVVEIGLLRFGPAAESLVNREQFNLRKLFSVFCGDFR
jgi:hypothetical protein